MNAEQLRVGFVVGPTGIGKSTLALDLAERLDAEIVNADSRLVYRGLNIGTAKPAPEQLRRVRHHLIDVRAPDDPLDVVQFRALADAAIVEIAARRKRVLMVGGSGFYIKVLRQGIFSGPAADLNLRAELNALAAQYGTEYLHQQLREVDRETADRLGPHDLYRIVRALEVFRVTGETISSHQNRHGFSSSSYRTLTIGLSLPRQRLYDGINRRLEQMVADGLVDEVRQLLAAGYRPDVSPLSTIGYKHVVQFLHGETTLEMAIALAQRDTRRLAKRQLTWLRKDPEIIWVDAENGAETCFDLLNNFFQSESVNSSLATTSASTT